jgi:hypothetical protein
MIQLKEIFLMKWIQYIIKKLKKVNLSKIKNLKYLRTQNTREMMSHIENNLNLILLTQKKRKK